MLKYRTPRKSALAVMVAASLGLAACSSNDDNGVSDILDGDDNDDTTLVTDGDDDSDDQSELNPNLVVLDNLELRSDITVPPAVGAENATGTGSISVDTETGAIAGSVTVEGTTGPITVAHIHMGAVGEAGGILVTLESNDDGTVWSVPEGEALDAPGIELFNDGLLYINLHTEANAPGELRVQLVEGTAAPSGSVTVAFRNLSESQPATPPNVILHSAADAGGIRFFEVGAPAIQEVILIAEDGMPGPLNEVAQGQIAAGTVSASGLAFPDPANPGPLTPGASSTITLMPELADQVMTIVTMVVCTNDGFSGIDSAPIEEGTFMLPIYDAGSESNVLTLDYWVPPCGTETNITDDENGVITAHPGQTGSENPIFDFEPGSEFIEVTVTLNP